MIESILALVPGEALAWLAIAAVLLVLGLVASLHPYVALAMGAVLLAVPVVLWSVFERRWFHSDGSAAGLVLFIVYAGFGVFCGTLGIAFLAQGVRRLARGKGAGVLPDRVAAFVAVAIVAASVAVPLWVFRDKSAPRAARMPAADEKVTGTQDVRDRFALAWKGRWRQRKLALDVPVADLAWGGAQAPPQIAITSDGPRTLELSLAGEGELAARLVLHRDDSTLDAALARAVRQGSAAIPAGAPHGLWIDTGDGGWRIVGLACAGTTPAELAAAARSGGVAGCHVPEAPLARHVPFLFGLDHVALHAEEDRHRRRCTAAFDYRGRPVTLDSPGACSSAEGFAALAAAARVLDRLGRDSAAPPAPAALAQRLGRAAARCEQTRRETQRALNQGSAGPGAIDRLRTLCGHAARSAASHVERAPEAASEPMLRALDALLVFGTGITRHLPELDAFIAAREAAGAGESREVLWARALRAWNAAGSTDPAVRRALAEAIARIVPAAEALAPGDPALEAVHRAASAASVDAALRPALLQLLGAWQRRAEAAAPGSDVALRVRFQLCRERMSAGVERETLGACADELAAAWQARIDHGKSFEPFHDEIELAMSIARMRVSHAWATGDFAAGAAGVRDVRERLAPRLPREPKFEEVPAALRKMEDELAAKAAPPTRR